jgi:hypothetical protein
MLQALLQGGTVSAEGPDTKSVVTEDKQAEAIVLASVHKLQGGLLHEVDLAFFTVAPCRSDIAFHTEGKIERQHDVPDFSHLLRVDIAALRPGQCDEEQA